MTETYRRRTVLTGTVAVGLTALAGCAGGGNNGDGSDGGDGGDSGDNVVAAGPNGQFVFDPETITISTGETVTWEFESANHNVAAYPDMHDRISIPDDADGFGSMDEGDAFETVPEGETYEYTFETPGEYTYVCMPHVGSDMVGTVIVE